ncbi:MAG: polymerase sigma-70 factor, subfamily [Actinomycetota bacterium]|jgi:RNA polymerase sigma-70 factor (ECF subfamily)|nr:polymerase sigma-70 factor, subfamily [Actinomycetota bacterium]
MQDASVSHATASDWEKVYREESPKLWRALVLHTGSSEVASDAVAEAFAQGIARGAAIKKPGAWVWRAAFMIARGDLAQRQEALAGHAQSEISSPERVMDLVQALGALSPMQRASIILRYFSGYSVAETAAILGSTRSAVGVHLFRARNKLRDELEDDDER